MTGLLCPRRYCVSSHWELEPCYTSYKYSTNAVGNERNDICSLTTGTNGAWLKKQMHEMIILQLVAYALEHLILRDDVNGHSRLAAASRMNQCTNRLCQGGVGI